MEEKLNITKKAQHKNGDVFSALKIVAWITGVANALLLLSMGPLWWIYDDGLGGFLNTFVYPVMGIIYLFGIIFFLKWFKFNKNKSDFYKVIGVILFSMFFIVFNIAIIKDVLK
jgi:hypothetical protein